MFCKGVELPQNGSLELGLGVGVAIVFTAALLLRCCRDSANFSTNKSIKSDVLCMITIGKWTNQK